MAQSNSGSNINQNTHGNIQKVNIAGRNNYENHYHYHYHFDSINPINNDDKNEQTEASSEIRFSSARSLSCHSRSTSSTNNDDENEQTEASSETRFSSARSLCFTLARRTRIMINTIKAVQDLI